MLMCVCVCNTFIEDLFYLEDVHVYRVPCRLHLHDLAECVDLCNAVEPQYFSMLYFLCQWCVDGCGGLAPHSHVNWESAATPVCS